METTSQTHRLKNPVKSERINRHKRISFIFNDEQYFAYEGDTLASALLANGISLVGRSFKYHRPRGIIGSWSEEPNAIFQIAEDEHTVPNLRATQVILYDGLVAKSVNAWPSLNYDVGAINSVFNKLLPAGFYYKTFMWPKNMWHKYESVIRKSAGLGRAPKKADPDRYEKHNDFFDLVIIGAGPSGLMAALTAVQSDLRILLVDEHAELGGSLLDHKQTIDNKSALDWIDNVEQTLSEKNNIVILKNAHAYGYLDHNFIAINETVKAVQSSPKAKHIPRERIWRVRAKQVILATGSLERHIAFHNNDRPGVMLASAVSSYLNRYAVNVGDSIVLFGNNNSIFRTAFELLDAGIHLAALVDSREDKNNPYIEKLEKENVRVFSRSVITNTLGGKRVTGVEIAKLSSNNMVGDNTKVYCDTVAVSGGFTPLIHLHAQSGGKAQWDDENLCFKPGTSVQKERSCGSANAQFSLKECLHSGQQAAIDACAKLGYDVSVSKLPTVEEDDVFFSNMSEPQNNAIKALWLVPSKYKEGQGGKQFIDFQNDTSAADIQLAVREGFHSIEHIKRYTALGFGTDQGRLGNIIGMAIAAKAMGKSIPETGTTTFRPPYTPVTFGASAGRNLAEFFDPIRKTAMHLWHQENNAEFENVGQWKRPWYYPQADEDIHDAVNRECLAVRNSVGIMDASTLGKIDIKGKDAGELLNRIYTNAWLKLGIGKCRYGLMLSEDGMVMDDGVTTRVAEDHYYMTTTTGGAANVYGWLEEWLQTEWTDLEVFVSSVTDHFATIAIVGPKSRDVLAKLTQDIDLDKESFPFMSMKQGKVANVDARVCRISFSGELAFEINVNAHYGRFVWQACMEAGKEFDITPYGTETMHVLRAEKGFIIVGQDTDGSVTPIDLGMDWIVSKNKDFIGKRSLFRTDTIRENRKQLVGLKPEISHQILPEGAQITATADIDAKLSNKEPIQMIGHVTSSYYSPSLRHSFALALVKNGHQKMGEIVYLPLSDGRIFVAKICQPVFYDEENARQNI